MIRGYVRTSGDEDEKKSPTTQKEGIERYANGRPIHWYEDIKFSGGDRERPGFARMERDLQPGDEIVVIWQDRFCRDLEFYARKIPEFQERGVKVVALDMLGIDPNTRTGKMATRMRAIIDEDYREAIKEKIAAARSRRGGKWGGAKYTDQEIMNFLKLAEDKNVGPIEAARRAGVSKRAFYDWRKRFGRPARDA